MSDECGGRYLREARFFLAGDKVAAQSHILDARSLMGYMRDMQSLGGPPIQVKYATLSDGTQIKAVMMNGQYQAQILSPYPAQERVEELCAQFLSGLLVPLYEGEFARLIDGVSTPYTGVAWLEPSQYQLLTTPGILAQYPDRPDRFAVEQFSRLTVRAPVPNIPPATYLTIFASAYSGEMRKVVQLLLGMGVELRRDLGGGASAPMHAYGYAGTIGLVRDTDAPEAEPSFWMVRMPDSAPYGVLAMRYPVCRGVSEEQRIKGVKYIPNPTAVFPHLEADIDSMLVSGSIVEILSRGDFDQLVAGFQPMYPDCGWAFSASGHECQTVVYAAEGTELTPLTRTKRVKFTFTADSARISCVGGVVESKNLWTTAVQAPRFPYILPGLMSVVAFDLASQSAYGDVDAPVHAYYIGDAEQVWRAFNDQTYADPVTINTITVGMNGSAHCPGEEENTTTEAGGSFTGYTLNGTRMHTTAFSGTRNGTILEYTRAGLLEGTPKYIVESGVGLYYAYEMNEISYETTLSGITKYDTSRVTFTVPFHQREGVFVLDSGTTTTSAHNRYKRYTGTTVKSGAVVQFNGTEYVYAPGYGPIEMTSCPNTMNSERAIGSGGNGINSIPGAPTGTGLVDPLPAPILEAIPQSSTEFGRLMFFGAAAISGPALTEDQIAGCLAIPLAGGGSQLVFAWTDAFEPTTAILSPSVNVVGSGLTSTGAHDISEGSMYYSFIGITS